MVLTKSKTQGDDKVYYRGSARNYSMSENQDLRQVCLDTGLVEYAQGHANAFGTSIAETDIDKFIDKTNQIYEDIPREPVYWVDFAWRKNEIKSENILTIADAKSYWGQNVSEPYVCIVDIPLNSTSIQLLSPDKHPTIKIHLDSGVDIMKFKSSEEEYLDFSRPNQILTAVCRCAKNEWNGKVTAQLIIEDYNIREEWVF